MIPFLHGLARFIRAWILPELSIALVNFVFLSGWAVYFIVKYIALSVKVMKKGADYPSPVDKLPRLFRFGNQDESLNTSSGFSDE